jgi:hypothetical protein
MLCGVYRLGSDELWGCWVVYVVWAGLNIVGEFDSFTMGIVSWIG